MEQIAQSEFGCASGDVKCYCENVDFGYGVRDCANEACSSPKDAATVIAYGVAYCKGWSALQMSSSLLLTMVQKLWAMPQRLRALSRH